MDQNTEDFYERLKTELDNSNTWPAEYLFKFIVPTDKQNIDIVESAFNDLGAVIEKKESKNGKFTSLSVNVVMQSAQLIVDKYLEVSTVEGIISL